ncbi:MAG: ABC transporter substrate binding protein [Methyloligellaceae bacterium]
MYRYVIAIFAVIFLLLKTAELQAARVLVVTWRGITDAEKGFVTKLKKLNPDVTFKYIDAGRSKTRLFYTLNETNFKEYDLVYSFGTTCTKLVSSVINKKVPHIFNIVGAPKQSKIVETMERPGNNITGAQAVIDIETQFNVLSKIKRFKSVAVWYDPREVQSKLILDKILNFGAKRGKTIVPLRIIPDASPKFYENQVRRAIQKSNKQDLLYITPTSSFFSISNKYFSSLDPSLLVVSSISKYVGKGVTLSLAANFHERGEAAAELANKILSGTPAGEISVDRVTPEKVSLYINKKQAQAAKLGNLSKLGIKIIEVAPE